MTEYTAQSKTLALIPKIPALLSMMGSAYIVHNILGHRAKRKTLYNRLMLGISTCDILASHAYFLSTWIIPRNSTGPFGPVFWAAGTDGTCSYGGFFNQLAVASPLYNAALSIYYLLKIRFSWSDAQLARIEPFLHGFPLLFAVSTAVTALAKDLYGSVFWTCWINPDPPQSNFRYFQWFFLFAPVWICIIIQTTVMSLLWLTMKNQERLMQQRYALGNGNEDTTASGRSHVLNERKRKQSQKIAVQGILYVCGFYITWFFPTVQRITELANGKNFFIFQALDTGLLPLQGLFNVLVYIRPKYIHFREKYPNLPPRHIFKMINDPSIEQSVVSEYTSSAHFRARNRLTTSQLNDSRAYATQYSMGAIPEGGDNLSAQVESIQETMKESQDKLRNVEERTLELELEVKWLKEKNQKLEQQLECKKEKGADTEMGTSPIETTGDEGITSEESNTNDLRDMENSDEQIQKGSVRTEDCTESLDDSIDVSSRSARVTMTGEVDSDANGGLV